MTASPAVGRGPGWSIGPDPALHPASIVLRVPGPGDAHGQQGVHQDPQDRGRVHDLPFTGAFAASFTNLQNREDHHREHEWAGEGHHYPDLSITEVHTGLNGPMMLAPADQARFGLPGLFISAGALNFSADPDGNITSLTLKGHVAVDVCAALS